VNTEWNATLNKKAKALWNDPAIQHTWRESSSFQLQVSNMDYLMANIDRFSDVQYIPTNEDILLARLRTTGVSITTLQKEKHKWQLIDVGGQSPERKKMGSCY